MRCLSPSSTKFLPLPESPNSASRPRTFRQAARDWDSVRGARRGVSASPYCIHLPLPLRNTAPGPRPNRVTGNRLQYAEQVCPFWTLGGALQGASGGLLQGAGGDNGDGRGPRGTGVRRTALQRLYGAAMPAGAPPQPLPRSRERLGPCM